MHMAYDIRSSFFEVAVDGRASSRELLLGWAERDRLGIVVDRPFGALDASLMVMLAATAFYDAKKTRRMRPLYPDMFLFHSGGPWGAHSALDFAPDHKEIHVAPNAPELLRAINHVGITHLLLPHAEPSPVQHRFKEPEAALDRIKSVFSYGPALPPALADVTITANIFEPLVGTFESTLMPEPYLEMLEQMGRATEMRATDRDELAILLPLLRARLAEVSATDPDRLRQLDRIAHARRAGTLTESYRRLSPQTALVSLSMARRA